MRFHFQVPTDTYVLVTEAAELADLDAARVEAAARVGTLLRDHAALIWTDEEWQMDVTDDRGLILFVPVVTAHRTAATFRD